MSNGDSQVINFTTGDRATLSRLETKIDLYHEEVKEMKDKQKWFQRTAVGALVTALVAGAKSLFI